MKHPFGRSEKANIDSYTYKAAFKYWYLHFPNSYVNKPKGSRYQEKRQDISIYYFRNVLPWNALTRVNYCTSNDLWSHVSRFFQVITPFLFTGH